MPAFIYRCPITGFRVHGDAPEQPSRDKGEHFEPVKCTACKRVHLINPKMRRNVSPQQVKIKSNKCVTGAMEYGEQRRTKSDFRFEVKFFSVS
jgi:hypothetical protein